MPDWYHLLRLSNQELARVDIAVRNLACAVGLPGSDRIDFDRCLRTLDLWAEQSGRFTERVMPLFHSGRCDYPDSEPRFRIQAMITCLQRDLGVRYRFDKQSPEATLEPADSFLHGILQGQGGTCGSMPVLYVAIGRRLGYPLRLAITRCHYYVRWDGVPGSEGFNIEASGLGVSFFPDEYFRTGQYAMPAETVRACGYLQSLSPREELASFLVQRGECWMQERAYGEAVLSFAWANEMDPRREQHAFLTRQALVVWGQQVRARLPPRPHFPLLDIGPPPPQFLRLPRDVEREIISLRITEELLNDPDYERRWWGPARRNPKRRPQGMPERLCVDYRWNNGAGAMNIPGLKGGRTSYSPNLGRWLTEDPIEFEGGDPNLYRYEANNPTNLLDPSGLQINPAVSVPSPDNKYNRAVEQVIRDPCHKSNFLIAGGGVLAYGTILAGPSILRVLPFWGPPVATQQDRIREALNQLSRMDQRILQSARDLLVRGQQARFMDHVGALAQATQQHIPAGQVHLLGRMNGNEVYGSLVSSVGITSINGVTTIVQRLADGSFRIIGPLLQ